MCCAGWDFEVVVDSGRSVTTTSWRLVVALSRGLGSVLTFLARAKGYFLENWGAPFVLGFMGLLLTAVVLLIVDLPWTAEVIGDVAYFSLATGVVLQLVCFLKTSDVEKERAEVE